MPRIAVDAMGSDAAPRVEVEGVLSAVRDERRARSSWSATSPGCAPSSRRWAPNAKKASDRRPPRARRHHHARRAVDGGQAEEAVVDADLLRPGQGGRGRRGGVGGQLGRDDGLRAVRAGAAAGRRAARHRHHVSDQGGRVRAAGHGRQRRSEADGAGAVRGAGLGLRAPAARQGPAAGRPAVERLRGAQGHAADARGAPAARPRPSPRAGRTSTTSATSRGATSSGARSTSSSPTGSPATSCSRAWRALAEVDLSTWCARRWRAAACWRSWARLLMTAALRRLRSAHRLRRARRRAAAGRRRRGADLPRRLERDGDQERGLASPIDSRRSDLAQGADRRPSRGTRVPVGRRARLRRRSARRLLS